MPVLINSQDDIDQIIERLGWVCRHGLSVRRQNAMYGNDLAVEVVINRTGELYPRLVWVARPPEVDHQGVALGVEWRDVAGSHRSAVTEDIAFDLERVSTLTAHVLRMGVTVVRYHFGGRVLGRTLCVPGEPDIRLRGIGLGPPWAWPWRDEESVFPAIEMVGDR